MADFDKISLDGGEPVPIPFRLVTGSRVINGLVTYRLMDFLHKQSTSITSEPSEEFSWLQPSDEWVVGDDRRGDLRARIQAIGIDLMPLVLEAILTAQPDSMSTRMASAIFTEGVIRNYKPLADRVTGDLDVGVLDYTLSRAQEAYDRNDSTALTECQLEAWEAARDKLHESFIPSEELFAALHRMLDVEVLVMLHNHASFNELTSKESREELVEQVGKKAIAEWVRPRKLDLD